MADIPSGGNTGNSGETGSTGGSSNTSNTGKVDFTEKEFKKYRKKNTLNDKNNYQDRKKYTSGDSNASANESTSTNSGSKKISSNDSNNNAKEVENANNDKETGNAGNNPLQEKELDVLDPEAKAKAQNEEKKSFKDRINDGKEKVDKAKDFKEKHFGNKDDESGKNEQENNQPRDKNGEKGTEGQGNKEPSNNFEGAKNTRGSSGGTETGANNAMGSSSTSSAGARTGTTSGAGATTGGTSGTTGATGTTAGGAGASGTSASAVGAGGTAGSSGAAMGAASTTGAAGTAGATGASAAGAAGASATSGAGVAAVGTGVAAGVGGIVVTVGLILLIILILIGVIGFFTSIPGLMVGEIKEFAANAWTKFKSVFTTEANASVTEDDIIDLANYLEGMDYNLIGYGFVEPDLDVVEEISDTYIDYTEVLEDFPYYEQRDGDPNYRYYNESGEAYNGCYYNSLGILINNSTGEICVTDTIDGDSVYEDKYGIYRSTTETNISGAGVVVEMSNVDTTLLRSYLLSDYRIAVLRNDDDGILNTIYSNIKKVFGGYDSGWSKGLIKIYLAGDGIATAVYNSSLFDDIFDTAWFSTIYIDTELNRLNIKEGFFNNESYFDINGWADRYGMSLEFLLSLHIGTMAPDLVYAMLQSFDTEVQVYLETQNGSINDGYVDLLNDDYSIVNIVTLNDILNVLPEDSVNEEKLEDLLEADNVRRNKIKKWVNNNITAKIALIILQNLDISNSSNCESNCKETKAEGEEACDECTEYIRLIIMALIENGDTNYSTYTPYIARVLGSWFRDTYFVIPEDIYPNVITTESESGVEVKIVGDYAIYDYLNESSRSSAEIAMIGNSYGENSTLVAVDEEYLGETGEYWTEYEMKSDDEYQLYYLNPDGTTSDTTMEEFIANPQAYCDTDVEKYGSQEEAEADGHAFVKKAVTKTVTEVENESLVKNAEDIEGLLWSAYEFTSDGTSGWYKITEEEYEGTFIEDVYEDVGEVINEDDGGFYYSEAFTSDVVQTEDAQRSETNVTVKWLFKYRKYYIYDGTESRAMSIAEDKEAVLEWALEYLSEKYKTGDIAEMLATYGRSALRQTYSTLINIQDPWKDGDEWTDDGMDLAEQWLEWQLDMYYSGIVEDGAEEYVYITDDLEVTLNEITRTGDPRNPNLIDTVKIDKSSLEAFSILENTATYAAEYSYRDFKELIVELNYFDKEDLSDKIESVFTWVIPDISNIGWPYRPYDKQTVDYGALIESAATYDFLEEIDYSSTSSDEDTTDEESEETSDEESEETSSGFKGYQGGEYVVSPVTGKVVNYGTHERTNVYTGDAETVGYIEIEILDADGASAVSDYSLFYDEYEDVCDGYTVIIDGFEAFDNIEDVSGGEYAQNEVYALYNTEEQERLEAIEQEKEDAPFTVEVDGETYIKEGKYIGTTYTDSEASQWTTSDGEVGVANYIRIIVKDTDYTVIDDVEDFFNIEEVEFISSSDDGSSSSSGDVTYTTYEGSTVAEKVWNALIDAGYSEIAAAGVMGNIACESGFVTNNLQDSYESSLGYTDEEYTEAVDSGEYSETSFVHDSAGYGLIQWTYYSRKQLLYDAAQTADASISDVDVQISVLLYEISTWSDSTKSTWLQATDVETSSKAFCDGLEQPANPNYSARAEAAEQYLELYGSD